MGLDLNEKYILKAETELNMTHFPVAYRDFMMKDNGGYVEIGDDTDEDYIGFYLYPISDTTDKNKLTRTCNHVVRATLKAREQYGLSDSSSQIADDGGMGIYFFTINPDSSVSDSVWYRRHTESDNEASVIFSFADVNS